jgi:tRNA U34 2-thiouridine synthase MnmA/TrmU
MKALALLSGGLDSTLAIKVILNQGIDIVAFNFFTPFCLCNRRNGCKSLAKEVSEKFGIELRMVVLFDEYIEIIKNPRYGYGSNLNPCIDCRILMFRYTRNLMLELNASFVVTGEVLGQRPMSQHKRALQIIERESGLEGLVLRPLSAKLLPPSIPEREGWVDRQKLLGITGRSRKPQMALARDYQIGDYPCPAGGCLLTDSGFARRMKDLITHSEVTADDIALLKVGRHFRLSPQAKLVVGRNKEENDRLEKLKRVNDLTFSPEKVKGPLAIGRGDFSSEEAISLACRIVARYSDSPQEKEVKITSGIWPEGERQTVYVRPMDDSELQRFRI